MNKPITLAIKETKRGPALDIENMDEAMTAPDVYESNMQTD